MSISVKNTPSSIVRAGSLASSDFDWNKSDPVVEETRPQNQIEAEKKKKTKVLLGSGAGILGLLGVSFKDGFNTGVERIGGVGNNLSYIASAIFTTAFPFVTLNGERENLAGKGGDTDDLFARMTYTAASIGFTPRILVEPFLMATRSPAYAAATIMNMPHMLFTLFSYTGGRAMGFVSALKKAFNNDPSKSYRREQEFESWYQIGNLGSAQASVVPMAGQFVMGLGIIGNVLTGDFSTAWEKFKEEPVTAFLGTFFNSWAWPFEYVAKFFDTTIRVAENAPNVKGALGKDSLILKLAEGFKNKWHNEVKSGSKKGRLLKVAREAAKVESLIGPPIGMTSVVLPTMDKFLRGEFTNEEAQNLDGFLAKPIAILDRVYGAGSFLGHLFYTTTYALTVRAPQLITASTFYISRIMNAARGIDVDEEAEKVRAGKETKKGYIDPLDLRKKIFRPLEGISNYAEKWLDKLERDTHDRDDLWLVADPQDENGNPVEIKDSDGRVIKGRGNCRHIRDFGRLVAQEYVYKPVRERLYSAVVAAELDNKYAENENERVILPGEKPTDRLWGEILQDDQYDAVRANAREQFKEYLRGSHGLDEAQVEQMVTEEYDSVGAYENGKVSFDKPMKVADWVEQLLDNEIKKCKKVDTANDKKRRCENLISIFL